ncbi:thiamine pyrophosphate-binding protein [Thermodesulfovibrio yellowstonii]|uniref:thiamine pyrophosphate-binding protein n=1 Tax=Thermodesulfovibrio yellowstonii TaxID=28262 RepID=UPI0024B35613|nr:thiamine pyrophosphate-binding protein [Thermodesulfovibrio yellowstonii]MDI6865163.1 thiamine pyrophosphate-binding protein [Thermodesulfovibrio yellowstonii]
MIKFSDYVMDFIANLGVETVFLLPGGGCMHLVDSLGRNNRLNYVCCLHEQAAAIAADGYAQFRNDIGVALVTTGPGGTNAITGVAGSWIDSTPLLIISGQVKRKDMMAGKGVRQMGVQEVDIVSLVKPITKYAVTITEPETVRYHLEKAVYMAKSGRPGPVWIDIPLDVQASMIDENSLKGFVPESEKTEQSTKHLRDIVKEVINLLNHAHRPVILAGRGIRLAKAEKEFLTLIEKLKIPVLLTWRLVDILPEEHELNFGRPGAIASRYANFILQKSDLLITIGARLDLVQIGYDYRRFAPEAKKIIVDIDESEIRKIDTEIDIPVVSDAGDFIREFLRQINSVKDINREHWLKRCKQWKEKYPVVLPEYLKNSGYVNTYALIDVLSELLTKDDLIVPGSSGSCSEITYQAFRLKKGQRLINSPGLGSMGFGLPQSIGVCIASGGKRTVCIVGDGGLQHNIQELETLKRLNLPVKLFVLNNNGYAAIRNTHRRFFEGRLVCCDPSSGLTLPDTCKIARAYGLKTVRITNQRDLANKVKDVLDTPGPVVCEVLIDPELQTAPRLSSRVLESGTIVSSPLEDLCPFLEREEVERELDFLK